MYKYVLPFRYLLKRRISYIAVVAVGLCVFISFVVMTVMTGLVGDFKEKNHRFVGDCVVASQSLVGFAYYEDFVTILEESDFVEAVSAAVKSFALLTPTGSQQNRGVEIMGVEPVRHSRVTGFGESLHYHKDNVAGAFMPAFDASLAGCILGIDMARVRNGKNGYSHPEILPRISLSISCFPLTAKGALAKAGTTMVNTKRFYYSDDSNTGLARVDGDIIYLSLADAQLLCGMADSDKRVSAIHVKFKENVDLDQGREKLSLLWQKFTDERKNDKRANLFENVTVQSWKTYRRGPIAAMEKEHTMVALMFVLVGITTVFIVLVVFYMIISHKSKDIGILKSIGVSTFSIIQLFSVFAFWIASVGAAIGIVAGWQFLVNINRIEDLLFEKFGFQLWDRSIYSIGEIPNTIEFKVVAVIIVCSVAACLAGAIIPSLQAARARLTETLQVNQL